MEAKWVALRQESNATKTAWIVGLAVVIIGLLVAGTWLMHSIAVPILAAVLLGGYFFRGTELSAHEQTAYRIIVFAMAFLALGPWVTARYGIRLIIFGAFAWFWFKRPVRKGVALGSLA